MAAIDDGCSCRLSHDQINLVPRCDVVPVMLDAVENAGWLTSSSES
jgi:hypothetical protein